MEEKGRWRTKGGGRWGVGGGGGMEEVEMEMHKNASDPTIYSKKYHIATFAGLILEDRIILIDTWKVNTQRSTTTSLYLKFSSDDLSTSVFFFGGVRAEPERKNGMDQRRALYFSHWSFAAAYLVVLRPTAIAVCGAEKRDAKYHFYHGYSRSSTRRHVFVFARFMTEAKCN